MKTEIYIELETEKIGEFEIVTVEELDRLRKLLGIIRANVEGTFKIKIKEFQI